jgi:uncharacterized protein
VTAAFPHEEPEPDADPPMSDASSLCVSCGLCCNGVLFSNARAQPEEVPRLRELGLEVEQVRGDRLQFRLPCPHHHEGHCGIYSDRFVKCRTFRCALLKRLDSGETSLADARATVEQARKMLARVTDLDPAWAQFRVRSQPPAPPAADETAEETDRRRRLKIEALALDLFFDRKFRNRKAVAMEPARRSPDGEER